MNTAQLLIHMLIIDPQNDFMDEDNAALRVPGATDDMQHLAALIDRIRPKLDDIHVTMDSHHLIDVAHPAFWRDQNGSMPAPFTIISEDDVKNGIWSPRNPSLRKRMLDYTHQLAVQGNYPLIIWPPHCLIGTPGHNVQSDLMAAMMRWEAEAFAAVDYVVKGTNPYTEHYGALKAEVVDANDPGSALNRSFLDVCANADIILVAGEALSHCVKETVQQIADNIGPEHLSKFWILTDCSSPVPQVGNGPDFPAIAAAWLKDMEARGMKLVKSTEIFL